MENKFDLLRKKYDTFIYRSFKVFKTDKDLVISYLFETVNLCKFEPTIEIPLSCIKKEDINEQFINYLAFNIGLVELLSYVKATCSKNIIIEAGYIDDEAVKWFKKLYYNGLGEFLYLNKIQVSEEDLFNIIVKASPIDFITTDYHGYGNLIPVGGGKDSNVTMELLKKYQNTPFVINPKNVHEECIMAAGYKNPTYVKRILDKNILKLNKEGFLNGHTPFSAIVAFISFLVAYLQNKKYIVLSNESSANESTIIGTTINHQYSKSYTFESDFNFYAAKYFKIDIKYFSLLRMLNESQISLLFSKYKKYHKVFKSCNVGSKNIPWVWCGECPKCLFVYSILSPYLEKEELYSIFNKDLFDDKSLLNTFLELLGYANRKPFECVGTYEEVRDAVSRTILNYKGPLPYLLEYYKKHYKIETHDFLHSLNKENFIPLEYQLVVEEELKKYV